MFFFREYRFIFSKIVTFEKFKIFKQKFWMKYTLSICRTNQEKTLEEKMPKIRLSAWTHNNNNKSLMRYDRNQSSWNEWTNNRRYFVWFCSIKSISLTLNLSIQQFRPRNTVSRIPPNFTAKPKMLFQSKITRFVCSSIEASLNSIH